jgi:hypothetical protein
VSPPPRPDATERRTTEAMRVSSHANLL